VCKSIFENLSKFTWQILFFRLLKPMQSKKRIHLRQFDIIHLPNPVLTYIRNPEKQNYVYALPPLEKLTSGILFYSLFLFHPPT
jgi:hypothetical protein